MCRNIFIILIVLIGFTSLCDAQRGYRKKIDKRFSAGIIGGLTMSQLDGDNYTGYDHRSIFGGLKVSAFMHEKLSFEVNFLYVNKGASIENEEIEFRVSFPKNRFIHLSYAEVPFLLSLKPNGYNSKLFFEGGISFSKMLNSTVQEDIRDFTKVSFEMIEPDFNSTDISAIVGIGSYLNKNVSIGLRFSYGLNKFYVNPDPIYRETLLDIVPKQVFFLRNYYISGNVSMNVF